MRTYKYFFIAENYDIILGMVENAKHNMQWKKQFMDFERELAYSFRGNPHHQLGDPYGNIVSLSNLPGFKK